MIVAAAPTLHALCLDRHPERRLLRAGYVSSSPGSWTGDRCSVSTRRRRLVILHAKRDSVCALKTWPCRCVSEEAVTHEGTRLEIK